MLMIDLIVPGKPLGKQRARTTVNGTYTPEQTVNHEAKIKSICENSYPGIKPSDKPIRLIINSYFKIPKNTSKGKVRQMIEYDIKPCVKPDADNIAKLVADALNGVVYKDDSQITTMVSNKFYGEIPRTHIIIREDI